MPLHNVEDAAGIVDLSEVEQRYRRSFVAVAVLIGLVVLCSSNALCISFIRLCGCFIVRLQSLNQ